MVGTDSTESQGSLQEAEAPQKPGVARRPRWYALGGAALALLCLVTLGGANVVRAKPCTTCHGHGAFAAQTQASAHATVPCRDCHGPSGAIGEVVFALQRPLHARFSRVRPANRDAAAVADERCLECHSDIEQGVVTANGIRIKHASCGTTASCTECHSATAHGAATKWVRSYDMEACLECHADSENVACDLCHHDQKEAERVKFAAFAVTHGTRWKTTHAMGDAATCTVCHGPNDCVECHGTGVPHEPDFVDVHTSYATAQDAQCDSCHTDSFCDACHGIEMPHPTTFTPGHSSLAKANSDVCERCHATSDCEECHEMHVHPGGAVDARPTGGGG